MRVTPHQREEFAARTGEQGKGKSRMRDYPPKGIKVVRVGRPEGAKCRRAADRRTVAGTVRKIRADIAINMLQKQESAARSGARRKLRKQETAEQQRFAANGKKTSPEQRVYKNEIDDAFSGNSERVKFLCQACA